MTRTSRSKAAAPDLQFSLQAGSRMNLDSLPLSRPRMRRLMLAALPASCQSADITLRIVGLSEGKALNTQFRQKNYATNILTFDYSPPPNIHADLVICLPVALKEARAQKKAADHHLAHLLVHGMLHACGLDHDIDAEAQAMEALETSILRRFRIPNPYLLPRGQLTVAT
jgi:probable rRNA maturation factor